MLVFLRYLIIIPLLTGSVVFWGTVAWSAEPEGTGIRKKAPVLSMDLGIMAGYRIDQVDWNIAGSSAGTSPNILSELTWEDLEIYQVQLESSLNVESRKQRGMRYHLQGMIGSGNIFAGSNQDSDYAGDNRTLEFSRSNNAADGGTVFDISVGAGLEFSGRDNTLTLIPLVGYSYHEQNLKITDGYQTVSEQAITDDFAGPGKIKLPSLGPIAGLDSSYRTEWYGPWLGLGLIYRPVEYWQLSTTFEYHMVEYLGEADWNLRNDLEHPVSFRHWADGTGIVFGVKVDGPISKFWSAALEATSQKWQTDEGIDVTYLDNGSRGGTRFNEANWKSFSLLFGLSRHF